MEKALERFFSEMRGRLETAESMRAIIARESSPDFNLLHALGIGEIHLSRLLACLLDPQGPHGQGPLFLSGFLDLCRAPGDAREGARICPALEPLERVTVSVEHRTERGRRIDILLRSGDSRSAIGIENKPWACDQEDQLADYRIYLQRAFPERWLLVYLVGDPDRSAPIEGERIRKVTYGELGKCFTAALGGIRSPIAAALTRQFLHYIEREFEGGWSLEAMTEARQIIDGVTANPQHVEVAWRLIAASEELRKQLFELFVRQLQNAMGKRFLVRRDADRNPGDRWFGLNAYLSDNPSRPDLFVRIEWEASNYRWCFLGIPSDVRVRENHLGHELGSYWKDVEDAARYFQKNLETQPRLDGEGNWIGLRYVGEPYDSWGWDNPKPWTEIAAAAGSSDKGVVDWFAGAIRDFWSAIDAYFDERGARL